MKKYSLLLIGLVFIASKGMSKTSKAPLFLNAYDKEVRTFIINEGAITLAAVRKLEQIDAKLEGYPLLKPLKTLYSCYNRYPDMLQDRVLSQLILDANRLEVNIESTKGHPTH